MKTTIYKNLEVQYNKLFRHLKVGSFKTRERYGKAFKRFMVFLAKEYKLQKLANISEKHILAYVSFLQNKGLSASTIKTELAAIRFFHDNMPYTKSVLPTNDELKLKRRTFGGVDRTWDGREYNLMLASAMKPGIPITLPYSLLPGMPGFVWRNASGSTRTTRKTPLKHANCL